MATTDIPPGVQHLIRILPKKRDGTDTPSNRLGHKQHQTIRMALDSPTKFKDDELQEIIDHYEANPPTTKSESAGYHAAKSSLALRKQVRAKREAEKASGSKKT